jgi:hypothetical protein
LNKASDGLPRIEINVSDSVKNEVSFESHSVFQWHLNKDAFRHSRSLIEENPRVLHVIQDVAQDGEFKCVIRIWNVVTVEELTFPQARDISTADRGNSALGEFYGVQVFSEIQIGETFQDCTFSGTNFQNIVVRERAAKMNDVFGLVHRSDGSPLGFPLII